MITAPLPVVFINHILGRMRIGTPVGAIGPGSYDAAFILMLALSIGASGLALLLRERRALRVGRCAH